MVIHKYTEEEKEFLRKFVPGHSHKEITEEFNRKFAENLTVSQIKGSIKRYGLNTGRTGRFEKGQIPHNKGTHPPTVGRMGETQFKMGHTPHNTKPLGYERISKDGYIEVKVCEKPDKSKGEKFFKAKHRIVWEEKNGEIPKNHLIIFLDGNPLNCDINNLALINRAEHLAMTRLKLRTNVSKLTETGVLIARAEVLKNKKINERRKSKCN